MNYLSGLCVKPSALLIVLTSSRTTEWRAMDPTLPEINDWMTPPMKRARRKLNQV